MFRALGCICLVLVLAAIAPLSAQAAVIYSSVTLANGNPTRVTWNAFGVGFVSPTNSIAFASPFRAPAFDSAVDTVRVAMQHSEGANDVVLSLFRDEIGLPGRLLAEVELRDVLRSTRLGHPSDFWLDVDLGSSIGLGAGALYWIGARAAEGSGSFVRWLRPSTDVRVENAFRNVMDPGAPWSALAPLDPVVFELLGDPLLVPQPGTLPLLALAMACLGTGSAGRRGAGGAPTRRMARGRAYLRL